MKALLDIPDEINQTLNIVKAQHKLKNKVEAISLVVNAYKKEHMEPELRPEFVERIHKTEHRKGVRFKTVDDLRKRYK